MKVLCWNVNGLNQCIEKGFHDVMEEEKPDVICLQEVKSKGVVDKVELDGYKKYYNFAERNGLWGVAIFTKVEVVDIRKWKDDIEGRVLIAEFEDFFIINLYVLNSGAELKRLDDRLVWDQELKDYVQTLKKKVIICGDLNVISKRCDIWKLNPRCAGCTDEERESFDKLLKMGFIDMFRKLHPEDRGYTYYSQKLAKRDVNKGWRLDYVLCNDEKLVKSVKVLAHVYKPSDHLPLVFEI